MKTKLRKTRNPLRERTRAAMVALLNQQLADSIDLEMQAKQAHWNVKGPNFIGLHELFEKVANELAAFSDELAERAVELGGTAHGTLQNVSANSRLKAYPVEIMAGRAHADALSNALAAHAETSRTAIDAAADAGDANTADLFTEVSRGVDKLLWLVEAHTLADR